MNSHSSARRALGDAVPAVLTAVAASVMSSTSVIELETRLPELIAAGLAGVASSLIALSILDRRTSTPEAPSQHSITALDQQFREVGASRPTRFDGLPTAGIEGLSMAKLGNGIDENEDAWLVDDSTGVIAVSDGASSSFGAALWSQLVVNSACRSRHEDGIDLVRSCVDEASRAWRDHHQGGEVAWWAQEGLRRGAFATLLLVRLTGIPGRRHWSALAVGDSCVMHLRLAGGYWNLLRSFPVESAHDFGSHPDLLSSVTEVVRPPASAGGELLPSDVLLLATDAVSEWLLGSSDRLGFAATAEISQVEAAIAAARESAMMVNDDATLVRYREP